MKLTEQQIAVLREVDDLAQAFRIAKRLGRARCAIGSVLQRLQARGIVEWDACRWKVTPEGRAVLASTFS